MLASCGRTQRRTNVLESMGCYTGARPKTLLSPPALQGVMGWTGRKGKDKNWTHNGLSVIISILGAPSEQPTNFPSTASTTKRANAETQQARPRSMHRPTNITIQDNSPKHCTHHPLFFCASALAQHSSKPHCTPPIPCTQGARNLVSGSRGCCPELSAVAATRRQQRIARFITY